MNPDGQDACKAVMEMARNCFGYGRWEAHYWFIGPEQGQSRNGYDSTQNRARLWVELGKKNLNDCRKFHERLIPPEEKHWHGDSASLQSTWKYLILLLLTFLDEDFRDPRNQKRLKYQSEKWGNAHDGETCVIELSGLPSHDLGVPIDHCLFRSERVKFIRQQIEQHEPHFVVMYGKCRFNEWERIAGQKLPLGEPRKFKSTTFLIAPHPLYTANDYWLSLGRRLRDAVNSLNV